MAQSTAPSGASPETRRVIHELRQPLAALQMWVELLGESLQGQLGAQQERYLAKVRAEVARIGNVLAASAKEPGATAAVTAGVDATDVPAEVPDEDPAACGALAGLSLLVVEDDEMTAEALQLALEGEGARVLVAGTIADGLERFLEALPDAVLSDLRVADGDGFALVAEIRRRERDSGRGTIAVAVTGYDSAETRAAARAAGFDETVTKPFAIADLVDTVARLIAGR